MLFIADQRGEFCESVVVGSNSLELMVVEFEHDDSLRQKYRLEGYWDTR